jgi:hypothetical protein
MDTKFCSLQLTARDHFEDLSRDWSIIYMDLKEIEWISAGTGFI